MEKYGRILTRLVFLLALSATAFSWIQFLWPPFAQFAASNSFWAVALELIRPTNAIYPGMVFGGWLFLFAGLTAFLFLGILCRSVLLYIEHSQVAISVLETDVHLSFAGPLMVDATLTRKQHIHANRYDVRSYRSAIATTSQTGSLVDDSFSAVSEANGDKLTKEVLLIGGGKSIELIEIYKRPLPVNPLLTYMPNSVSNGLRGFFKKSVIERRTRLCLENEYNQREASISVSADRFPVSNVTIRIDFHTETAPRSDNIRAFLIKDNIADEVDVIPDFSKPEMTVYRARRSSLKQAMLRLTWTNDSLIDYCQQLGADPVPLAPPPMVSPPKGKGKGKGKKGKAR